MSDKFNVNRNYIESAVPSEPRSATMMRNFPKNQYASQLKYMHQTTIKTGTARGSSITNNNSSFFINPEFYKVLTFIIFSVHFTPKNQNENE